MVVIDSAAPETKGGSAKETCTIIARARNVQDNRSNFYEMFHNFQTAPSLISAWISESEYCMIAV